MRSDVIFRQLPLSPLVAIFCRLLITFANSLDLTWIQNIWHSNAIPDFFFFLFFSFFFFFFVLFCFVFVFEKKLIQNKKKKKKKNNIQTTKKKKKKKKKKRKKERKHAKLPCMQIINLEWNGQTFSGGTCVRVLSSLRKHAFSNILKIFKNKNDIFHISAQNKYCGYSTWRF